MSFAESAKTAVLGAKAAGTEALCSLVYRSRAVVPLSDYELYGLVKAAQVNNSQHGITGLMLYDDGRFYQWLEGPPAEVNGLMRSISNDKRHTDIEILSDKPAQSRQFGGWQMRLATRGARSIQSGHNVVVPSLSALANIHLHPGNAREVLAGLSAPSGREAGAEVPARPSNAPLKGPAGAILKDIIITAVVPELITRHARQDRMAAWPIDARARALADLLIGPDTGAALDLLRTLQSSEGAIRHLYENLVEPTARRLGDLWGADLCSELDVSLGLAQLQRAIRVLNEEIEAPTLPKGVYLPAVLIVPEPGEAHMLNAVLDSDALAAAGWDPLSEFPATDEALQDMIADSWFDALDISLSPAMKRESWLPRVTKTIALARHASRNPALVVVVAGRVFAEDAGAGARVGADAVSRSTLQTERLIRDGVGRKKK